MMLEMMAALVLEAAWQATAVAVLAVGALHFAKHQPATLREGVLVIALVKFLTPPFVLLPGGLFAMLPVLSMRAPASSSVHFDGGASFVPLETVALTYTTGAVAVLAGIGVAGLRVMRLRRRALPAPEWLCDAAESVAHRIGLRRPVAILLSDEASTPIAIGAWRAAVVVPRVLVAVLSRSELEAVLAHELAHHRRRHLFWAWVRLCTCALWWWNPAVWIVSHRLRHVQEEACDDTVVDRGIVDRERYCDVLIRVAKAVAAPLAATASLADRLHPLAARIERLLAATGRPTMRPFTARGVVAMLALLLLPGVPRDAANAVAPGSATNGLAAHRTEGAPLLPVPPPSRSAAARAGTTANKRPIAADEC